MSEESVTGSKMRKRRQQPGLLYRSTSFYDRALHVNPDLENARLCDGGSYGLV
jgi:hypothetical protein